MIPVFSLTICKEMQFVLSAQDFKTSLIFPCRMPRVKPCNHIPCQNCLLFPVNIGWNTDITAVSVDPASDDLVASKGLSTGLHPDFGAGLYDGAPIGIPYVVVAGSQPKVKWQIRLNQCRYRRLTHLHLPGKL